MNEIWPTSCSFSSVVLKLRFLMKSVEPGADSSSSSSSSSSSFSSFLSSFTASSFSGTLLDRYNRYFRYQFNFISCMFKKKKLRRVWSFWVCVGGILPGSGLAATNTPTGAHSKYSGTCWNCNKQEIKVFSVSCQHTLNGQPMQVTHNTHTPCCRPAL